MVPASPTAATGVSPGAGVFGAVRGVDAAGVVGLWEEGGAGVAGFMGVKAATLDESCM
jgi:hypothetical protein